MKTLQECKAEVAKKHGLGSTLVTGHMAKYWEESAKLFASEACKEQREICSKEYRSESLSRMNHNQYVQNQIKNAPEPTLS